MIPEPIDVAELANDQVQALFADVEKRRAQEKSEIPVEGSDRLHTLMTSIDFDDLSSAVQSLTTELTYRHGDGDGAIHVHVQGLISPDNLGKVIEKINQRVKKGQSYLTSSNTHRITRKSV